LTQRVFWWSFGAACAIAWIEAQSGLAGWHTIGLLALFVMPVVVFEIAQWALARERDGV
jgi:hypothetical protein